MSARGYSRFVSIPAMRVSSSATRSFSQRLLAGLAVSHDLREHRVVKGRHLGAALHPAVDAHAAREAHLRERAPRSAGSRARILGVDAHFEGVTLRRRDVPASSARPPRGGSSTPPDPTPVTALGHAVLDLEARVHLEEVELLGASS